MAELKRAKGKQRPFTEEELQHWLTLLTLMDDEFLEVCFSDNNRGVELILRIILDKDDLVVQRVVVQKTLPNLRGRRCGWTSLLWMARASCTTLRFRWAASWRI